MCKSLKMYKSQINSHVGEPRGRYSTSDEDLNIICCFFAFQETSDEPMKKQYHDVDFLESVNPIQYAFELPRICRLEDLGNNKSLLGFSLRI